MRCDTENDCPGIQLAVECFERMLYKIYYSKLSPQVLSKMFNLKLPGWRLTFQLMLFASHGHLVVAAIPKNSARMCSIVDHDFWQLSNIYRSIKCYRRNVAPFIPGLWKIHHFPFNKFKMQLLRLKINEPCSHSDWRYREQTSFIW